MALKDQTESLITQSSLANGIELAVKIMQNLKGRRKMDESGIDTRRITATEINNTLNNRRRS